jgi:hypothetical protein
MQQEVAQHKVHQPHLLSHLLLLLEYQLDREAFSLTA